MTSWWVVVTNASLERRAALGLGEIGFDVWFPTREVQFKTRHMKKPSTRTYPVFPGYLFVRARAVDFAQTWHGIHGVDGVKAILCNDWRPVTVSDVEIAKLRAHLDIVTMPVVEDGYRVGQTVMVVHGPFQDLRGEIARVRRKAIDVMFSIMGRPTPVVVPFRDVRRVA